MSIFLCRSIGETKVWSLGMERAIWIQLGGLQRLNSVYHEPLGRPGPQERNILEHCLFHAGRGISKTLACIYASTLLHKWALQFQILFQVQYGGRVTDDFDKRLLCTFTSVWFSEALLQPGFKFYEGYPLPDYKTIEEYIDHIINMPLQDIPEVFGLHSNADISYQVGTQSCKMRAHAETP